MPSSRPHSITPVFKANFGIADFEASSRHEVPDGHFIGQVRDGKNIFRAEEVRIREVRRRDRCIGDLGMERRL